MVEGFPVREFCIVLRITVRHLIICGYDNNGFVLCFGLRVDMTLRKGILSRPLGLRTLGLRAAGTQDCGAAMVLSPKS